MPSRGSKGLPDETSWRVVAIGDLSDQ
jgi:hypothetical protein